MPSFRPKDRFRANFKVCAVDESLMSINPFSSGKHIGCYAVMGDNGVINLIPPTGDAATFWKCVPNPDKRAMLPTDHGDEHPDHVDPQMLNPEILDPQKLDSQMSEPEVSNRDESPRFICRFIGAKQKSGSRRRPQDNTRPQWMKPVPYASQRKYADQSPEDGQLATLDAKDLAEFFEVPEEEALRAIRAVSQRPDDRLDRRDFKRLKEYFAQRNQDPERARKKRSQRDPRDQSDHQPKYPNSGSHDDMADRAGEALILHGRGKKYTVDVILGEANVQIGNAQLAYDQITAIHSSPNCCLAILTKKGRILLQCSSKEVRNHWKRTLEVRSRPSSREFIQNTKYKAAMTAM